MAAKLKAKATTSKAKPAAKPSAMPPDRSPAARKILDQVLGMQLYLVITEPLRAEGGEERFLAHLNHQVDLERRGIMFGAGPIQREGDPAPFGGMIVIRAKSFADARRIFDSDPYHKAGARKYKLYRWNLNEGTMTFRVNYTGQTVEIS
jgi:uncharacterized protein YciI